MEQKNLRELAKQLTRTANILEAQALAQEHAEIFNKVLAPGGIFHGPDWHKNFEWHLEAPSMGNLVANGFDQELYFEQMKALSTHPDKFTWARGQFGCGGFDIHATYLSFTDPHGYVPFIKKHDIKLTSARFTEWTQRLETVELVCSLLSQQEPLSPQEPF